MTPWPHQTHTSYVIRMEKLCLKRVEVIDFGEMLSIATCWSQARPLRLTFLAIHLLRDGEISLWRGKSGISCALSGGVLPSLILKFPYFPSFSLSPKHDWSTWCHREQKVVWKPGSSRSIWENNYTWAWTNVSQEQKMQKIQHESTFF